MTTSFANDQGNGYVEADGLSGPNGTALRSTGGVGPIVGSSGITVFHSGDAAPPTTTTGTDTTPVVTETYITRVFVQLNSTLTGISLLNGSAVAGNITVALLNSAGAVVAQSASTVQAGIAGYQQVPFATPYAAKGPAIHWIAVQCNNTGARIRTHTLGNFTAAKQTGQTYGTFTAFVSPNTFTTNVGPIADTY